MRPRVSSILARLVEAQFVNYPEGITATELARLPNMPSRGTVIKVLDMYVEAGMADRKGSKYTPHKEILGRIRGEIIKSRQPTER